MYYRVRLREELKLPISTLNMLYRRISGVSEEMINTARSEISALSNEQLLATSLRWEKYMKEINQLETEKITNYYGDLLADLENYLDLENPQEKADYLKEKPDLKKLIDKAISLNISVEHEAMANFINAERLRAIAKSGNQ